MHARLIWNAVTAVIIGTLVCIWVAYYSDRLPEVTAILGGGGILVWVATAFSFLKKDQQDAVKDWTGSVVFGSRGFTLVLTFACLAFILLANFLGSVEVESIAEEPEHSVLIYPEGETASSSNPHWLRLTPAQPVRSVVWTSWFCTTNVVVKVRGYPDKVVDVHPFHRTSIAVPGSVRSAVLLLRPTLTVTDIARGASMKVEVTAKDEHGRSVVRTAVFDGHAVLVGGSEDILIPSEMKEMWRNEVGKRFDIFNRWATPVAPEGFSLHLTPGQTLQVQLLQNHDKPYGSRTIVVVTPLRSAMPFVQEVVLYGTENNESSK